MTNLIILHGWNSRPDRWRKLKKNLEKEEIKVFVPLLPGFGDFKLEKPWFLDDYVGWLKSYLKNKGLKNYSLLGYSFGGRIAILFASQKPKNLSKIILINSAGVRNNKNIKRTLFYLVAKAGNLFFSLPFLSFLKKSARRLLYLTIRENDYFMADKTMRITLKNIVNFDLRGEANKIRNKALLIWGKEDKQTPFWQGKILHQQIQNSQLIVLEAEGHVLSTQAIDKITSLICRFFKT